MQGGAEHGQMQGEKYGENAPVSLPDSDRNVDERVSPVEDGQHVLVALPKKRLHGDLLDGEQEAEDAVVLQVEDGDAVLLRRLPDAVGGEDELTAGLDADVEEQVDGPVEHLDEEGEFLDEAAVPVVGVARGIGSVHHSTAAAPLLGRMRRLGQQIACCKCVAAVAAIVRVVREVLGVERVEFCVAQQALVALCAWDDGIVAAAIDVAREHHDAHNHLQARVTRQRQYFQAHFDHR